MQKRNNIMLHFHGAIEGNQAICLIEDGYLYLPAELSSAGEENDKNRQLNAWYMTSSGLNGNNLSI